MIGVIVEARILGGTLRTYHESERIESFGLDRLPEEEELIHRRASRPRIQRRGGEAY